LLRGGERAEQLLFVGEEQVDGALDQLLSGGRQLDEHDAAVVLRPDSPHEAVALRAGDAL